MGAARLLLGALLLAGCRLGYDVPAGGDGDGGATADAGSRDGQGGDGDGGAGAPDAGGTTTVDLSGTGVTRDTALNSFAATLNYGGGATFNVRDSAVSTFTGLLAFDLTGAVDPDRAVVSASIDVTTGTMALSGGEIEVYRVLEDWVEGNGTGTTGVANYAMRTGALPWLAPGCGDGSREAVPLATFAPVDTGTTYTISLPPAVVEAWADDPSGNHGVALVAAGTGNDTVVFIASEGGDTDRPRIRVVLAP
jgi:hypothetical protein